MNLWQTGFFEMNGFCGLILTALSPPFNMRDKPIIGYVKMFCNVDSLQQEEKARDVVKPEFKGVNSCQKDLRADTSTCPELQFPNSLLVW